jgi:hypothetical protein
MKRFLAAILALVYLSFSTGVMVHLHYCMGKFVSWSLSDHGSKVCDYCGMPKKSSTDSGLIKNNCCQDEHKQIKTEKDQKTVSPGLQITKPFQDVVIAQYPELGNLYRSSLAIVHPNINGPPPASGVAAFLLNCNFRI